jgi:hypothetical protein
MSAVPKEVYILRKLLDVKIYLSILFGLLNALLSKKYSIEKQLLVAFENI